MTEFLCGCKYLLKPVVGFVYLRSMVLNILLGDKAISVCVEIVFRGASLIKKQLASVVRLCLGV